MSSPISMLTKLLTPKQLASIDKPSLAIGYFEHSQPAKQRNWGCLQNWFRVNRWKNIPPNLLEEDWFHLRFFFFPYSDSYTTIYYIYFFNHECIYTYFRSWCHLNLNIWVSTTSLKLVPRSFPTWRWHPLVCSHPPPQVRFAKLTPIDPSISACDHSKNIGIHHTSLSWDLSGLDFSLCTTPPKKTLYKLQCTFRSWHMSMIFPGKAIQILLAKEVAGFQASRMLPLTYLDQKKRVTLASGELPGKIPRSKHSD